VQLIVNWKSFSSYLYGALWRVLSALHDEFCCIKRRLETDLHACIDLAIARVCFKHLRWFACCNNEFCTVYVNKLRNGRNDCSFIFTNATLYAVSAMAMAICLCVCHKPVLFQNGERIELVLAYRLLSNHPIVVRNSGISKNKDTSLWDCLELWWTQVSYFATGCQSWQRVVILVRRRWTFAAINRRPSSVESSWQYTCTCYVRRSTDDVGQFITVSGVRPLCTARCARAHLRQLIIVKTFSSTCRIIIIIIHLFAIRNTNIT